MQLVLLVALFADSAFTHADAAHAGAAPAISCGSRTWTFLRAAVDNYCQNSAAPSEALGCRVARFSFTNCRAAATLDPDDDGTIRGSIRDPRNTSYAWLLTFKRTPRGFTLSRFAYEFDDCDALGIPDPPRGPLPLRALLQH